MNFEEYEDDIIRKLSELPETEVKALPDTGVPDGPGETVTPQLYVSINNCNLDNPAHTGVPAQKETIQGEILFYARQRRGEYGIFKQYELVTELLMGYRPQGALTGIILNGFSNVSGSHNNWQYSLSFSFTGYRIPKAKEDESEVSLKQIDSKFRENEKV